MKIPVKTAGEFSLPGLGLGTWMMGGGYKKDPDYDPKPDVKAIQSAIKFGITHIDTAELYAEGLAEEIVGEAITNLDRSLLFITSKVIPERFRYHDLIAACQASLKRVGTSYFDLYLLHAPNSHLPIAEPLRAMEELYDQGLIRHIGVSNFNRHELAEAQQACKYKIVNNQIHYSLSVREHDEAGTLEHCRANDILITAYRPLDKGKFSEKGGELLAQLARKYNKTPVQIALNWVISQSGVVTIFKSANPEHIKENLGCIGWELEEKDRQMLQENYPRDQAIYGPRI